MAELAISSMSIKELRGVLFKEKKSAGNCPHINLWEWVIKGPAKKKNEMVVTHINDSNCFPWLSTLQT